MGAVGFSAGAMWAFLLSNLEPEHVKAVVAFYGSAQIEYAAARAAYVGHYAEEDEWADLGCRSANRRSRLATARCWRAAVSACFPLHRTN